MDFDVASASRTTRHSIHLKIICNFITTGPPDPPTGTPSVTRSKNSVTIAWRSPAYDGGCTITGYTIEMNRREENSWTVIAESCHSLSHTVLASSNDSIVAGESYRFRVRGENIHGVGEPSAPSELVRIPREGETILQNEEEEGNWKYPNGIFSNFSPSH